MIIVPMTRAMLGSRAYAERVVPEIAPEQWRHQLVVAFTAARVEPLDVDESEGKLKFSEIAWPGDEPITAALAASCLSQAAHGCYDFRVVVESPTTEEVAAFLEIVNEGVRSDLESAPTDAGVLEPEAAEVDAELEDALPGEQEAEDSPAAAACASSNPTCWTLLTHHRPHHAGLKAGLRTYEQRVDGGRLLRVTTDELVPGVVVFAPESASESVQIARGVAEHFCARAAELQLLIDRLERERMEIKAEHDRERMDLLRRPRASLRKKSTTKKPAAKKPAAKKSTTGKAR